MQISLILFLPIVGFISRLLVQCNPTINYEDETSHVFTTVFHKYSERVRPYNKQLGPVEVKAYLDIVDILSLDTKRNQLESIVDLRLTWNDARLQWNTNKIPYITVNDSTVWTPDVAILNALEPPQDILRPRFVVIERPGDVYQYARLRIKTACRRHDAKSCEIRFGSNLFTESELIFTVAQCGSRNELLSSGFEIETKNITGNMSVIEHNTVDMPVMFSPKFKKSSYSIVSCEIMISNGKDNDHEKPIESNVVEEETDDDKNSAEQTIQRTGLLLVGIILVFIS